MTVLDERYELLRRLDQGGWTEVWRAVDRGTNADVVVKMLRRNRMEDHPEGLDRLLQRLRREARIHQVLGGCPFVPDYVTTGRNADGDWYLVSSFVDGRPLRKLLRQTPEGVETSFFLLLTERIAEALKSIHSRRILHRDLSPANIVLTAPDESDEPTIHLVDFGIGKNLDVADTLTLRNTVMGTPPYIAPEQITGERVSAATDVYALGVIAYEMLTGHVPIAGTGVDALTRIRKSPPTPLTEHEAASARVPEELRALVMACLEKEAARRPTTDELLECVRDVRGRSARGVDISAALAPWEHSQTLTSEAEVCGPLRAGARFDRFDIHGRLGCGPDSEAWAATDRDVGHDVVLKVLMSKDARRRDVIRTAAEAATATSSSTAETHREHVVTVLGFESAHGLDYVVREHVRGRSLDETLRDGVFDATRVFTIGAGILDALKSLDRPHGHLHAKNVLLDDFDHVRVSDAETGVDVVHLVPATDTHGWVATLAPERLDGTPPTETADIYAFGCLVYAMMAGRPVFDGLPTTLAYRHAHVEPEPPPSLQGDVDTRGLARLVTECLAKNPERRPAHLDIVQRRFVGVFSS